MEFIATSNTSSTAPVLNNSNVNSFEHGSKTSDRVFRNKNPSAPVFQTSKHRSEKSNSGREQYIAKCKKVFESMKNSPDATKSCSKYCTNAKCPKQHPQDEDSVKYRLACIAVSYDQVIKGVEETARKHDNKETLDIVQEYNTKNPDLIITKLNLMISENNKAASENNKDAALINRGTAQINFKQSEADAVAKYRITEMQDNNNKHVHKGNMEYLETQFENNKKLIEFATEKKERLLDKELEIEKIKRSTQQLKLEGNIWDFFLNADAQTIELNKNLFKDEILTIDCKSFTARGRKLIETMDSSKVFEAEEPPAIDEVAKSE